MSAASEVGPPHTGEWTERYRRAVMNTFGTPPRVLARGEGARVWDVDGREYLDLLGGIAVNALGHGHPAVVEAVTRQLSTLGHVSNLFISAPQVELAETLLRLLGHDGRVFFCNSGAEANEAALKATRRTGRTRVVAAEGSFHGRTMGALSLTSKQAYRAPFEPLPGGVTFVPYGDVAALEAAVDDTVAAVILEPIQGEAGVIDPPDGYLVAARRITAEHGSLLWFDEIQTGIARTGDWFGHTASGVVPDLVTLAKGLGGGVPIGALVAVGEAATLLQPGDHGTTFGGNPVATAAAAAVIATIERDDLLAHVRAIGDQIAVGLAAHPAVDQVSGRGLLRGLVLRTPQAPVVVSGALEAGLLLNAPAPHRIRLAPPLVLTSEQAAHAVTTLSELLTAHAPVTRTNSEAPA